MKKSKSKIDSKRGKKKSDESKFKINFIAKASQKSHKRTNVKSKYISAMLDLNLLNRDYI